MTKDRKRNKTWEEIKINQDVEEIPDILQPCEVVANLLSAEFEILCWRKLLNSYQKICVNRNEEKRGWKCEKIVINENLLISRKLLAIV